ncbi:hypothetical protein [Streptomyces sp. NPDC097640]|uniref:hypothetical protein n=1 Tax=Streptomyces sp. NPDC097640 TaxID=3157229 RepID=UPI00331945A2
MTQPAEPEPTLDALCARTEADDMLDRLIEAHDRTVADLNQVLDVEAGLAEILNHNNGNKEK